MTEVKICGVTTTEALFAALDAGARYVGLVFYPDSPRYIKPETAARLSRMVPTGVRVVGLFVEPDEADIESVLSQVPLDMLQIHGTEDVNRLESLKNHFGLPVIAALRIGGEEDVHRADEIAQIADYLLFDTKPPSGITTLPGGTGLSFDWGLLSNMDINKPWFLAGGLRLENIGEALSQVRPTIVDVSSGVESSPGHKDSESIRVFIEAVKQHDIMSGDGRTGS